MAMLNLFLTNWIIVIFVGVIAVWGIVSFWLGHPWLPRKLLKKM
jgi:hypothetical protein